MPEFKPRTITFFCEGDPKGQPRIKGYAKNVGMGAAARTIVKVYTPGTKIKVWKREISVVANLHRPKVKIDGPVKLDLVCYFDRPKKHFFTGKRSHVLRPDAPYYHEIVPDFDNLSKAVADALTRCEFWTDDCKVALGTFAKVYKARNEMSGVRITIITLPPTMELAGK